MMMRERFCMVLTIVLLVGLVYLYYRIGVHTEKIGWLEDNVLYRLEKGGDLSVKGKP